MFVKDNLRLHKPHFDQIREEVHDLHYAVSAVKEDNKKNLEARVSYNTMANIRSKLHQESTFTASIDALDKRVSDVECQLNQVLINQTNQQKLLLTLLQAQNISIPTLLDDHKKGEKSTSSTALATTSTTTTANLNPQVSTPPTPKTQVLPLSHLQSHPQPFLQILQLFLQSLQNKCLQLRGSHQLRGSNLL